ncbi:MAG: oligosaccharide flippase family protein [Bacteroidia bacterium]|nr:oligosaccharide flippase family protein [Bacteroidia bacterium]MDW8014723.1 oligosaccharide flippase family protein [Bacteroidia bacterium]
MKGFQRDLLLVVLAHLVSKPIWLVVDNLAQNRIGHQEYGLIGALLGFAQWAAYLADWGLYALVTREMARSPTAYPAVSSTTFTLKALLTCIVSALFLCLGWIIGYRGKELIWLGGLLAYHLALSYLQYFRAFFQGAQRFRIDALLSASEKAVVLLLLAGVWSVLNGNFYVGTLVVGGLCTSLGAGISVWRSYGMPRWSWERGALWQAFHQMTPFALMGYAGAFNERLNQLLLERWVGAYANGLYWGAYRWFAAATMYLWIILPLFFARFAKLGRQRSPELWRTFLWGQVISALPPIGVAGLFLGAPQLFLLLFTHSTPEELASMSRMLQLLAFPLTVNALTAIYSTYITAVGYEWIGFWLTMGAAGVNALSCLFLLPTLQGEGAVIALGLSYCVQAAGFVWTFYHLSPLPFPHTLILRLLFFAILYGGSTYGIGRLGGPLIAIVGSGACFFLFWAWALGLFRWRVYADRH